MRVALLEDDVDHAALIVNPLQEAGHSCQVFGTGSRFLQAISKETFDILILDWSLPDITGLEVLDSVRQRHDGIPILFVTSRDAEEDVVEALKHGADDFVVKPARPSELLARLIALKRRSDIHLGARQVTAGPYTFDLTTSTARINDTVVALTDRQFQLAIVLFRNTGRLLSRTYLLESVWGLNAQVQTRTLDIHVSQLRNALRLPENGWRITAIYAHGYRLEPLEARN